MPYKDAKGNWVWADGTPLTFTPSAGERFRRDNYAGNEDCAGFRGDDGTPEKASHRHDHHTLECPVQTGP